MAKKTPKKSGKARELSAKGRQTLEHFFTTLFDDDERVALSLLPIVKRTVPGIERAGARDQLIQAVTQPGFFDATKTGGRFACFGINPLKPETTRAKSNVLFLKTICIDIDKAKLPKLAEKAHFVFTRDKSHHHLYFLIEPLETTPANLEKYTEVVKAIIHAVGGDTVVHDPSRAMRIPVLPHIKANKPVGPGYALKADNTDQPRYTLDKLFSLITGKKEIKKLGPNGKPSIMPDDEDEPSAVEAEQVAEYIVNSFLRRETVLQGDGRSKMLFFVGLDCHGWGVEENEAYEIGRTLNDKLCDPPEPDDVVEHQIKSAYRYRKGAFGDFLQEVMQSKTAKDRQKQYMKWQEVGRVRSQLQNHVYVVGAERLIDTETGAEFTTDKQQNLYIAHRCGTKLQLRDILSEHALTVLDALDFRPDIPSRLYHERGLEYYNRFKPLPAPEVSPVKTYKDSVKTFIDHCEFLTNTPAERDTLIGYFAFVVQNLGKKILWAPLIISRTEGLGKSLLELLFRSIYGRYVGAIENRQLTSNYTNFMKDKVMCFVHELAQGNKHETMNLLKNLITETTITVQEKWARDYDTRNTVNFVFFSNRPDAIHITAADRRLFVVYNDKAARSEDYYRKIKEVFTERAGDVHHWLLNYDLKNFKPYTRPLMTEGKRQLIEQSTSELDIYLHEQLMNKSGPFEDQVVYPLDVLADVEMSRGLILRNKIGVKAIQLFLISQQWQRHTVMVNVDGKRTSRRVYCAERDPKKVNVLLKKYCLKVGEFSEVLQKAPTE